MNRFLQFDTQSLLALHIGSHSRLSSLWKMMTKLWGVLVFGMVVVLDFLKGFDNLWFVTPPYLHAQSVLSALYLAWALLYTGFLQCDDVYNRAQWVTNVAAETKGNKSIITYAFGLLIWLIFLGIEAMGGEAQTAFLMFCGVAQLFTLFMGNSLREQARNLLPFLSNIVLLAIMVLLMI